MQFSQQLIFNSAFEDNNNNNSNKRKNKLFEGNAHDIQIKFDNYLTLQNWIEIDWSFNHFTFQTNLNSVEVFKYE